VDECAWLPYQVFRENLLPLLQQKKTSLIAASTALGDRNYFSTLCKLKDPATGKLVFNVCQVSQICKDCRATETPQDCTHLNYKMPAWKSAKRTDKLRLLYAGNDHEFMREIKGEIANEAQGAYASGLIKRFMELPLFTLRQVPKALYWGIDPGGGGPGETGHALIVDFDGVFVVSWLFGFLAFGFMATAKDSAMRPASRP
jgi:hypothetical protein